MYIAGHTGLIGSALLQKLSSYGYQHIITRTHQILDLTDKNQVETFFSNEKPEYLFLAAAKVGGIHANSTYPAEFTYQNLMLQTNVVDLAYKYGVKKLLFLASSCIYPKICQQPMNEEYLLTGPIEPTNEPFGVAKLAGIKMCQAYNKQYGTNFISIIPSNVYGPNDHFNEDGHVIASLINKFHQAKVKKHDAVTIWGTGKPVRDFLYVDDLADACLFLMEHYNSSNVINIGTGSGTTIAELAGIIKNITSYQGEVIFDTTKPDGNPERRLDATKIYSLGWRPKTSLEEGLKLTYEWYKKTYQQAVKNY